MNGSETTALKSAAASRAGSVKNFMRGAECRGNGRGATRFYRRTNQRSCCTRRTQRDEKCPGQEHRSQRAQEKITRKILRDIPEDDVIVASGFDDEALE